MKVLAFCLLVMFSGCALIPLIAPFVPGTCPTTYADDRYHAMGVDITHYVVPAHMSKSQRGVPIGPGVDGKIVDATFEQISSCLGIRFEPCAVHAVMIAPDWSVYPGTTTQVFPCNDPRPGATKLCTGANQWPGTIIITPNYYALPWEIARMLLRGDPNLDPKKCWQKVR